MDQQDKTENNEFHKKLLDLLKGEYDYAEPKQGDIVEAVILSITDHDIVVDLGAKRDGIIPARDLSFVDPERVKALEVGDRIPVMVWRTWGESDGIIVSLNKGLQQEDWLRAEAMLESGETFVGEVVDQNRGGVIVPFGRLRGFVPNSHLSSVPSGLRAGRQMEDKASLVGKEIELAVIEVNQRRRRLVFSKRAADRRRRGGLLEELKPGQIRKGVVRNIVDFGVFVDLGGLDGLVHISELDWRHVDHPSDVLKLGDEIEVEVLSVDPERQRIGLSRKRLLSDPWNRVVEHLSEADVVEGTVTNIVPFGVFVDVGEGVEGLVHTSEMPGGEIVAQTTLVAGATVHVRVLRIDQEKHQLALRLEPPWPDTQERARVRLDELAKPGATVEGRHQERSIRPEQLDELPRAERIEPVEEVAEGGEEAPEQE